MLRVESFSYTGRLQLHPNSLAEYMRVRFDISKVCLTAVQSKQMRRLQEIDVCQTKPARQEYEGIDELQTAAGINCRYTQAAFAQQVRVVIKKRTIIESRRGCG